MNSEFNIQPIETGQVSISKNSLYPDTPEDAKTDDHILSMMNDHYLDNVDYHDPFFVDMVDAFGFWDGSRQWIQKVNGEEKDLKKENENAGKPALTKNKIFPMVNLVCGIQSQEPLEMRCVARSKEDGPIADGNNDILKWQWDTENGNRKISRAFWSGVICGRGWLEIPQIEDEKSLFGTQTAIYYVDAGEIMYDRKSQEYDLSDCDFLQRIRLMSRSQARLLWPDKEYELNQYYSLLDSKIQTSRISMDRISLMRSQVSILEEWYRVYQLLTFILDSSTGIIHDATGIANEQLMPLIQVNPHVQVIRKRVKVMKYARSCGHLSGVLLDTGDSPYDDNYYPYVPFFAYRSRDLDFGVVKQVMDPQREINKRSSQLLYMLNTMPKTRLVTDDETAANKFEAGDDIVTVQKGTQWTVVPPPAFSAGHARLEEIGKDDIKTISGVNDSLSGIRESNEPGIVVNMRRNQQMMNIALLFDNLKDTDMLIAKILMSRKRQYMTPQQVARIIGSEKAVIPGLIEGILSREAEEFDINIIQTPSTPSMRIENFEKLKALMQIMPALQPLIADIFVEASDVPQKDEINSRIEQVAGARTGSPISQPNPGGAPLPAPNSGIPPV